MIRDIDYALRLKHRAHIYFAAGCIAQRCGLRVSFFRKKKPTRKGRMTVYRIEGIAGDLVGQEMLRQKLYDLTGKSLHASLSKLLCSPEPIHGFTVRTVGFHEAGKTEYLSTEE